jgi:hypothetical protein
VKLTIARETGSTHTRLGVETDAVSGYLMRLFEIDARDLGEVVADSWLDEARKNNRQALRRRTGEILRERRVEGVTQLSPNLVIEILKFAQDEGRPVLIEIWSRLLAGGVDPSRSNLRLSFIETVKRMDPPDAMLIERMVHRGYRAVHDEDGPAPFNETTISLLANELNLNPDAVFVSLEHLEELGILANGSSDSTWRTTSFGRELFRACYRYR